MSLGFTEILFILVVILLLFGPKRIPELAKALGKASAEYKRAKDTLQKESEELIDTVQKSAETDYVTQEKENG